MRQSLRALASSSCSPRVFCPRRPSCCEAPWIRQWPPLKQICTSLSTFKAHRRPHMAYVDKTALVARIVSLSAERGYFVNRPPKFGKTVLLDTIATYFKGNREAFRGLAIYDMQMPWEEFPIIRFSMNEFLDSTRSEKPRRLLDEPQQQRCHTSFRIPY